MIGVIHNTELWVTIPDHSHLQIGIKIKSSKDIGRKRRKPSAIRSQQAPRLSSQEFPFASAHAEPEEPHAWSVTVGCYCDVTRSEPVEVSFQISQHIIAAKSCIKA